LSLHLPFIHLCPILYLDPTLTTPPSLFSWPFETTPEARERNLQALQQVGGYIASASPIAAAYAAETGLTIDLFDPNAVSNGNFQWVPGCLVPAFDGILF
jgi:zeaxanthin glucosyltransferase